MRVDDMPNMMGYDDSDFAPANCTRCGHDKGDHWTGTELGACTRSCRCGRFTQETLKEIVDSMRRRDARIMKGDPSL